MTEDQWKALVQMWSDPKHKKQNKYKNEPPNAIDLFKELHCSSKTGFTEPVKEVIAQMEAIMAEPTQEGQAPKTLV